jgi:hypothetical protein
MHHTGGRSVNMRRKSGVARGGAQELVSLEKKALQTCGVTRLDREALEDVMRDDVFLAGDGKMLGLDQPEGWTRARRTGRRS